MSGRTNREQELQRVGVFTADNALQTSLSRLEDNVSRALRAQHTAKSERPAVERQRTDTPQAQLGRVMLVDPSTGSLVVDLPKVTPTDNGQSVWVKNTTTSATTATVRAATGQLIDDAATITVGGPRFGFQFMTDGVGWFTLARM
jgi:hypothetical protein